MHFPLCPSQGALVLLDQVCRFGLERCMDELAAALPDVVNVLVNLVLGRSVAQSDGAKSCANALLHYICIAG